MAEANTRGRASDGQLLRYLLQRLKPKSRLIFFSLCGYLVYSSGVVFLADLLQFLLDALAGKLDESSSLLSVLHSSLTTQGDAAFDSVRVAVPLAIVLLTLVRAVGYFGGNYFMHRVAREFVHELRTQLFGKMLYAPNRYFDAHSRGVLLAKITYNIEQMASGVTQALTHLLREGLVVIALMSYMVYLDWKLSLIFAAVTPIIAVVVFFVGKLFRRYSRRIQGSMGDVTQVANESFSAIREIKTFGAQRSTGERFAALSQYNRDQSLKLAFAEALSTPVLQLLLALAIALLIWFALSPDTISALSPGGFAAFLVAAVQLGKPVRQLSSVHSIFQRGLAAAEDIFQQIEMDSEVDVGQKVLGKVREDIEFSHVVFSYPGADKPVLHDVSFRIAAGETVAIVGPSGSGKSTLLQLLCRFYQPDSGSIAVDGIQVEELTLENLRKQIALVSQSPTLFRASIAENLGLGELARCSRAEMQEALAMVDAMSFIEELPSGLDTVIGNEGDSLSGGQRQRLALARAILKRAPLFIMDEATSALDSDSEQRLQKSLGNYLRERTAIIVTHRISTIVTADRILVMQDGRIDSEGTHEELLAREGLYAQLYHQGFTP
jgi:ATP-binding cassette, subfamily B, bacterial MsbA